MAIDEHRTYLRDENRFTAYDRALARLCAHGPVVLDLGAGTGLLGLTALRHGASRVYGVESTGFVDWTEAIARRNSAPGSYVVLSGKSLEIDLPEPVDLVVCDQLGGFLLEGRPFPVLADAARRHLRPGGTLVPGAVEFWAAPTSSQRVADDLSFWSERRFDFDVGALHSLQVGSVGWEKTDAAQLASAPVLLGSIDTASGGPTVDFAATATLEADTNVNAIAGWFQAHLGEGVSFGTSPRDPRRIDRENALLTVDPPIFCAAGDELEVRVRASFAAGIMTWTVRCREDMRKHSTWSAFTAAPIARG